MRFDAVNARRTCEESRNFDELLSFFLFNTFSPQMKKKKIETIEITELLVFYATFFAAMSSTCCSRENYSKSAFSADFKILL